MKQYICEFYATPVSTAFTPNVAEIARKLGHDYPSRQLMIETCSGESHQRVETWAQAIAVEREWRYISTTVVTSEWLESIRGAACSRDRRAIQICLALNERPWLKNA